MLERENLKKVQTSQDSLWKFVIWTLAIFFMMASPLLAQSSQRVKAKFVTGDVKFQKRSQGDWKKVKVGAKISHRDRIRTFAGARHILT